jgi:hypothetical protein
MKPGQKTPLSYKRHRCPDGKEAVLDKIDPVFAGRGHFAMPFFIVWHTQASEASLCVFTC